MALEDRDGSEKEVDSMKMSPMFLGGLFGESENWENQDFAGLTRKRAT
jgi:hypothetical protein